MTFIAILFLLTAGILAFENIWHDSLLLKRLYGLLIILALVMYGGQDFFANAFNRGRAQIIATMIDVVKLLPHIEIKRIETVKEKHKKDQQSLTIPKEMEKGAPRFTSVYPRHAFMENYDEVVQRYPSLAFVFDGLETGQWREARDASQLVFAEMQADKLQNTKLLQAYVQHLQAVAMLEMGLPRNARLVFDDAQKTMVLLNAPKDEINRLNIDRGIAIISAGNRNSEVSAQVFQSVTQSGIGHEQDISLLYYVRELEARANGSSSTADIRHQDALTYAQKLNRTNPVAANRLSALYGELFGVMEKDPQRNLVQRKVVSNGVISTPTSAKLVYRKTHQIVVRYENIIPYNADRFINNYDQVVARYASFNAALVKLQVGHPELASRNALWAHSATFGSADPTVIDVRAKSLHLDAQGLVEQGKFIEAIAQFKLADKELSNIPSPNIDHIRIKLDMASAMLAAGQDENALNQSMFTELMNHKNENLHELALYYRIRAIEHMRGGASESSRTAMDEAKRMATELDAIDHATSLRLQNLLAFTEGEFGKAESNSEPQKQAPDKTPVEADQSDIVIPQFNPVKVTTAVIATMPVTGNLVSNSTAGTRTSHYTVRYPKRAYLYPTRFWTEDEKRSLRKIFDSLDVSDWQAASENAIAAGKKVYVAGDSKTYVKAGFLFHLAGIAKLEMGQYMAALQALDFSHEVFSRGGATKMEIYRVEIDHALALLAAGSDYTSLDRDMIALVSDAAGWSGETRWHEQAMANLVYGIERKRAGQYDSAAHYGKEAQKLITELDNPDSKAATMMMLISNSLQN
jgi:hypothetical protein